PFKPTPTIFLPARLDSRMSVSMAGFELIDIDLVLLDQLAQQSPVLLRRLRRASDVALMTFQQPADKARLELSDSFRFGSLKAFRVGSLARAGQVDLRSLDLRPLRERYRPFHYVLQFAHISRPVVQQKFLHGARRDVLGAHGEPGGDCGDKMTGQQRNVVAPLAQRR